MDGDSEGASGGAGSAFDGIQSAASSGLLARDAGDNPGFAPRRNFGHTLDFNSPRRYNERTPEEWRTVAPPAGIQEVSRLLDEGDQVDPQLKQLMKELGDAINESLSDSEQISEVVARIKEGGYDIFLVLEATIGVSKQGEKPADKTSMVTTLSTNPEFKISDQDLKFLKSLRIKIDEEKD
ncbi:MAG TPA: hypothetical protein VMX38_06485 [Verrucomicrobiae bacterium]|jgi:hypothetical protein|nr:hypothetical protein [Verrucomicrobiae bacterium]